MLLGMSACLPENVFTDSTSINADAFNLTCTLSGHNWDYDHPVEWIQYGSCVRDTILKLKCKRCGTKENIVVLKAEKNHDWGKWYYVEEPTCELLGRLKRECKNCDCYEMDFVDPKGHSYTHGPPKKTFILPAQRAATASSRVITAARSRWTISVSQRVTNGLTGKSQTLRPARQRAKQAMSHR